MNASISKALCSVGLNTYALVDYKALELLASISQPEAVSRYSLLDSSGAVVVLFPYDPYPPSHTYNPSSQDTDSRLVRIASFAAHNIYRALSRLLKQAASIIAFETNTSHKAFRVIVNSRLPEKKLALLAGLGAQGKSGLFVSEAYGPACLIAALLLPPSLSLEKLDRESFHALDKTHELCNSCQACVKACPTQAISDEGFIRERCIQFWTTKSGKLPSHVVSAWGNRLYGCDTCVAACPESKKAVVKQASGYSHADEAAKLLQPDELRPGAVISASFIQQATDAELKAFFHKTALGMSWIGFRELRRNAAMAAMP